MGMGVCGMGWVFCSRGECMWHGVSMWHRVGVCGMGWVYVAWGEYVA